MATRKKAARKTTRKAGKATRRSAAKRPSASLAPKAVKTGKGPAPLEVAKTVLALLRAGNFPEVHEKWLAPSIVSVEGVGASIAFTGKKAVLAKYGAWEADHQVHDSQVEGPWVGATGFSLKFKIDVTQKSTGQRTQMEEIAVYTVQNGKIVREEFHFAAGG